VDLHPRNRKVLHVLDMLSDMIEIETISEDVLEINEILNEELEDVLWKLV